MNWKRFAIGGLAIVGAVVLGLWAYRKVTG